MTTRADGQCYVYIMTNSRRTLYVGVTNDIERRVYEHKHKLVDGFTKRYNITWLVHYEETSDVVAAIEREKQVKGWRRSKKGGADRVGEPPVEGSGAGMVRRWWTDILDSSAPLRCAQNDRDGRCVAFRMTGTGALRCVQNDYGLAKAT